MKWYLISLGILFFLIVLPFIVVKLYIIFTSSKERKEYTSLEDMLRMLKIEWEIEEKQWWYPIIDFFKSYRLFIIGVYWNIVYFIQKLFKGYSDREILDMSYFLAKWMVKRLPDYIEARKQYEDTEQEVKELELILYFFKSIIREYNLEEGEITDKEKYELGKKLYNKYVDGLYL